MDLEAFGEDLHQLDATHAQAFWQAATARKGANRAQEEEAEVQERATRAPDIRGGAAPGDVEVLSKGLAKLLSELQEAGRPEEGGGEAKPPAATRRQGDKGKALEAFRGQAHQAGQGRSDSEVVLPELVRDIAKMVETNQRQQQPPASGTNRWNRGQRGRREGAQEQ